MTHDQVIDEIVDRARARGVLSHYCGRATRCQGRGLPDLLLASDFHVGWIEVKMPGDAREPDQTTWAYKLRASGQLYEVMGPRDLGQGHAVDQFLEFISSGRLS